MNKWMEIFVGLIFIVVAVLSYFYTPTWYNAAIVVLKGSIVWMVLGIGLVLLMLGISELKG